MHVQYIRSSACLEKQLAGNFLVLNRGLKLAEKVFGQHLGDLSLSSKEDSTAIVLSTQKEECVVFNAMESLAPHGIPTIGTGADVRTEEHGAVFSTRSHIRLASSPQSCAFLLSVSNCGGGLDGFTTYQLRRTLSMLTICDLKVPIVNTSFQSLTDY